MLALPITTGFMGFFPSIGLFLLIWAVMLLTGFFFVDVNCHFHEETNLISMAGRTLGLSGKVVCWVFYLLLLYSLVAAYIAGSAPMFQAIFQLIGVTITLPMAYFCLPFLFGLFFYFGMQGIDLINRILMGGLFLSYLFILLFLPSHIEPHLLLHHDWKMGLIALPVVLTSFGFHIIIPSLGTYMQHDRKRLKRVIVIGSFLALVVYTIWQLIVLGIVPLQGKVSLLEAWKNGESIAPIGSYLEDPRIGLGASIFAFFAIVTSFLGVSLSLSDFLIDGFRIKKTWEGHILAYSLTFVPPIFFVLRFQRGFITALEYAGVFVAILLGVLPALMVWKLRPIPFYRKILGKSLIYFVFVTAIALVVISLVNELDGFKFLIEKCYALSACHRL